MRKLLFLAMIALSCTFLNADGNVTTNNKTVNSQTVQVNDDFQNEFKEEKKDFDPLSGYNRAMTSFNDSFYTHILEPTARGYAYVVPKPARKGISNFFDNLKFPIRFINNILQFKFKNALEETGRFLVNSTFGLLGFMDPAKDELNWVAHKEDFGQTLGFYGIGEGFHIVLPFLGPSNLRDTIGLAADGYISPLTSAGDLDYKIPDNALQTVGIAVVDTVNDQSLKLGQYEKLKEDAIDLYPYLRTVYNQNREKQIRE